jgi:hypothetical protein
MLGERVQGRGRVGFARVGLDGCGGVLGWAIRDLLDPSLAPGRSALLSCAMRERIEFSNGAGLAVCDSRYFPIVVLQWFGKLDPPTIEQYAEWIRRLLAWMEHEQVRGVLISDLRGGERPTPAIRRQLAEGRHSAEASIQRSMIDNLLVIDDPAIRGAVSAITWVKPDLRMQVVASIDKALVRARELLGDAGIAIPEVDASAFDQSK